MLFLSNIFAIIPIVNIKKGVFMKKKLAFASLMLVGTIASAMDVNYFVAAGVYRGYTTLKYTGLKSGTRDKNEGAFVIDGGTLFVNTHKIDLEYAKYNDGSGRSMQSIGLGYEYLIDLGSKFRPFVGVSYDIVKYSRTSMKEGGATVDAIDLTTNALMGRIGTEYDFTQHFYASASYDYALTKSGNTHVGGRKGSLYIPNAEKVETDKLSKFEFLVGYKF